MTITEGHAFPTTSPPTCPPSVLTDLRGQDPWISRGEGCTYFLPTRENNVKVNTTLTNQRTAKNDRTEPPRAHVQHARTRKPPAQPTHANATNSQSKEKARPMQSHRLPSPKRWTRQAMRLSASTATTRLLRSRKALRFAQQSTSARSQPFGLRLASANPGPATQPGKQSTNEKTWVHGHKDRRSTERRPKDSRERRTAHPCTNHPREFHRANAKTTHSTQDGRG